MITTAQVNADRPPSPEDMRCVPGLVRFNPQYLVLSRCVGFIFEPFDCLECISEFSSFEIIDALDDEAAARATFELYYDRAPIIESAHRKPTPHDIIRTVEVRDICFEGAGHA